MRTKTVRQGFTLIELLIVIAIIGLLATLAIVSLTTAQQKARDTKRVADMKQFQNAVELYFSENPTGYPTTDAGAATPQAWSVFSDLVDPYLTQVPAPPDADGGEVYTYGWSGGTNPNNDATDYVLKATLEDTTHDALDQSIRVDQTIGGGVSTNNSDPGATASCDTGGEYCLTN